MCGGTHARTHREYAEQQYKTWLPKIDPTSITSPGAGKKPPQDAAKATAAKAERPKRAGARKSQKEADEGDEEKAQDEEKKTAKTPIKRRGAKEVEEGGVGTEKATPQQRKRRERKSATMPGEAAADAATTPAPAKPRERKTTEAAKRRASSATPTPKGGLAAAGSVTPASGADGSLTPTPKRKPGRPRGPRRKSEGAPAGTTAAPTAGAASDGRSSSSAGPAIVSAPHSGAASASTPRAAAHPAAAAESAPPVSSGPKPVTHSARYLAWLTARQQQAPLAAGPSTTERAVGLGADTQTVLASLSPSDRGVLGVR